MPAEVLYRKWRPQRFADVAGQELLTRTLVNALKRHKVSHAYLLSGPRGTGKTTTGRLIAKAINCERNAPDLAEGAGEPCNECASCVAYLAGRALDLIELDAASNRGIDEIRQLRENANYAPTAGAGAHKVYLVDEVHMLTEPAFNALLKMLEEPPPHIVFVLATTDAHKIPATIVSRCQRHELKRIPLAAMVGRLAQIAEVEGYDIAQEGLEAIARHATGSLRDAINLLEQICDSYGGAPSLEAVRDGLGMIGDERAGKLALHALRGELAEGLELIGAVRDDGLDLKQFLREVVQRLRELLLLQVGAAAESALPPGEVEEARAAMSGVSRQTLVQALRNFGECDLRSDPLSPLPIELALAETILEPNAARAQPATAATPQRPPAADAARRSAPTSVPEFKNRQPATPRPEAPAMPTAFRKPDLNKPTSAEEIAAMLQSKAPIIPPAGDGEGTEMPAANGSKLVAETPAADATLASLLDDMRAAIKPKNPNLAAKLNGSGHAVSWQDGILTLGFYADFHRKQIELQENRRQCEEAASQILGASASIRCIMTARPAKPISSPLVQHAIRNLGAKIVSEQ